MSVWDDLFGEKVYLDIEKSKRGKFYWIARDENGRTWASQKFPHCDTYEQCDGLAKKFAKIDFIRR